MSRYVLTHDQLERLLEQIQDLRRINAVKEERIRELELHKLRVSSSEVAELLKTIAILEEDIADLKKVNRRLTAEAEEIKDNAIKVQELKVLLEEERRLREYSETLAKHMEERYNDEMLLKDLTTELCQLQKTEIELETKRIEELEQKLKNFNINGKENLHEISEKEIKQILSEKDRDNVTKNKQLKLVVLKLHKQMSKIYEDIQKKSYKTEADKARLKELNKWLQETRFVMTDMTGIEELRKDLSYLRNEIENKRKSVLKFKS